VRRARSAETPCLRFGFTGLSGIEARESMQDVDRPYHHGDLRRVVIETAVEMLREGNEWQFTLREVARRAGVSHA
jgi:hypothetical protein